MGAINVALSKSLFLPHYQHLLESDSDIDFLWGGRDTGKSYFIAQKLIKDCLHSQHFRCILIKKVERTIKDSQYQVIRSVVHKWGLESLFTFKRSPLEITCVNGGAFIARGCDSPTNLKSITDPTHAWYEEADQLSTEDFVIASTTLRSNYSKIKQYVSFNPQPKGNYKKHWIYPYLKEHYERGVYSFSSVKVVKLEGEADYVQSYTSTHGTYRDNPYCTPQRRAALEELSTIDKYYYKVYTLGLFGSKKNESPFVISYDSSKHLGRPELNREEVLWLSFDFNRDPMCCSVIQHYGGVVYVLRTIKLPNSDIYQMCTYIKSLYYGCMFLVTGDASGSNSSALVKDNANYYTVIKEMLELNYLMLRVPASNPRLEQNRMLINAVLSQYPVILHEIDAAHLVTDFEQVKQLPSGGIDKTDRKKSEQQADALDTWRYFCNIEMKPYVHYVDKPIDPDSDEEPDE